MDGSIQEFGSMQCVICLNYLQRRPTFCCFRDVVIVSNYCLGLVVVRQAIREVTATLQSSAVTATK